MTPDQEARLEHAYHDLVAEARGVVECSEDPIGSREALRAAKMRLNEMEQVLNEAHG